MKNGKGMKKEFSNFVTLIEESMCNSIKTISFLSEPDSRTFLFKTDNRKISENEFKTITDFLFDNRNRILIEMPTYSSNWLKAISNFYFTGAIYERKEELFKLFQHLYQALPTDKYSKPSFIFVMLFLSEITLFEHNELLEKLSERFGFDVEIFCIENVDNSLRNNVEMVLLVSYEEKSTNNHATAENENLVIPGFLSRYIK